MEAIPSSLSLHFTIMYHTTILMPNVKTPRMMCFITEFIGASKKSEIQTNLNNYTTFRL